MQESPLENIVYLYPRRPGYTAIAIITRSPKGQRAYQLGALARGVGRALLALAPKLMKTLSVEGPSSIARRA